MANALIYKKKELCFDVEGNVVIGIGIQNNGDTQVGVTMDNTMPSKLVVLGAMSAMDDLAGLIATGTEKPKSQVLHMMNRALTYLTKEAEKEEKREGK